ncbi:hemolysin family protein [Magnetococcus sp. PR-3]|uniref:hemolysin family protein n=1 Tax=Magnetococcus sp. PR-3 TaxID=3120355 RepID=UPI002FCE4CB0
MDLITVLQLLLFVVLLLLSGLFSSSETALFSLDKLTLERMRQNQHPKLAQIQTLLSEPRRLIVTILIGNELVNVAASNISATLVMQFMGGTDAWWVNIFIMLPILLLVGEITPKTIAVRNNDTVSGLVVGPINLFATLVTPLRGVVRVISELLITLLTGGRKRSSGNIVTEDLVRTLADEAAEDGDLDEVEAEYIHNIIEFGNQTVEAVMTPRSNMVTLNMDDSMDEVMAVLREQRVSRVPVFDEENEAVVGVLYYRDLLSNDVSLFKNMQELRPILRRPFYVPETKPILDLMHNFREKKRSLALILDEYGGTIGLVTMGDLLESIFGEIHDPEDPDNDATVESLENGCFRLDGNLDVDHANALMKARFDTDMSETIAGLLLHAHGELPEEGTVIALNEWCFRITKVEGTRIMEAIACHAGREIGKAGCLALLEKGEKSAELALTSKGEGAVPVKAEPTADSTPEKEA